MLKSNRHGGGCCGIKHLSSFENYDNTYDFEKIINRAINQGIEDNDERYIDHSSDPLGSSLLFEVVLNQDQLEDLPNLTIALSKMGFKEVNSFNNLNSGNECYIFHLIREI